MPVTWTQYGEAPATEAVTMTAAQPSMIRFNIIASPL
jgi:hypothetical protein